MEVKVLTDEKDNLVIELDNQTIAELLRVYLNKDSSVVLAAWKRPHPNNPIIFEIKTKGKSAKKALEDAADEIEKETSKVSEDFKKALK
jgi:DNA-directed RNA polymerase subunit L